jgi:putative transposase
MDGLESPSHSKWERKYPVVFIPKRRRKTLYAGLRKHLGKYFTGWPGRRRAGLKKGI